MSDYLFYNVPQSSSLTLGVFACVCTCMCSCCCSNVHLWSPEEDTECLFLLHLGLVGSLVEPQAHWLGALLAASNALKISCLCTSHN